MILKEERGRGEGEGERGGNIEFVHVSTQALYKRKEWECNYFVIV